VDAEAKPGNENLTGLVRPHGNLLTNHANGCAGAVRLVVDVKLNGFDEPSDALAQARREVDEVGHWPGGLSRQPLQFPLGLRRTLS
jgi:hypothetical protein